MCTPRTEASSAARTKEGAAKEGAAAAREKVGLATAAARAVAARAVAVMEAAVRGAEAAVLAARIGSSQELPHHRSGSSRLRGYWRRTPRAIRRRLLP